MTSKTRYVKSISEVQAYRLTRPSGNNRTVAILVDGQIDKAQNLSMGMCVIDPNSQIPLHAHDNEEEAMYVVRGRGIAKIENTEYSLSEGSVIFCPPRIRHQIINPNKEELSFIFVYGPPGPEQGVKTMGELTEPIMP